MPSKAFISLFFQENPVSGRKADVIKAAHLCAEAALRLVKPGNQVSDRYGGRHVWAWGEELRHGRRLRHVLASCVEMKACDLAREELPSDAGNLGAAVCRQLSRCWGEHQPAGRVAVTLPCGTRALPQVTVALQSSLGAPACWSFPC